MEPCSYRADWVCRAAADIAASCKHALRLSPSGLPIAGCDANMLPAWTMARAAMASCSSNASTHGISLEQQQHADVTMRGSSSRFLQVLEGFHYVLALAKFSSWKRGSFRLKSPFGRSSGFVKAPLNMPADTPASCLLDLQEKEGCTS